MKRRDILKAGSGALALSGWMIPAQAATTAAAAAPAFAWTRAKATQLVGQTFWLNHPDRRALALVLKTVFVPKRQQPRMDQFSLFFDSVEANIAPGTYEFEHPAIGHFALHVVPATPAPKNKRYRADFSLLA